MVEFQKVVGSRAEVMHCVAHHTSGGLLKKDLKKDKAGERIISKAQAKLNPGAKMWMKAVAKARKDEKTKGFVLLKQGEPLYERAREIYDDMKTKSLKKK